jgi:hypothetical protein
MEESWTLCATKVATTKLFSPLVRMYVGDYTSCGGNDKGKDGVTMPDADIRDVKSAVRQLADTLPDDATWDDVMYRVYVCQAVEAGLRDAADGQLVDVAEVRRQFGLVE